VLNVYQLYYLLLHFEVKQIFLIENFLMRRTKSYRQFLKELLCKTHLDCKFNKLKINK
jgi:hypothetical protein